MLLAESAAAAVGPAAAVIERRIFTVRGHNVMLDSDLAQLYGVETKAVKRAVNRNPERFPPGFLLVLTAAEVENLRYQSGTSSLSWGGARYAPYAFTEHGVAMLSSVLRSPRAVAVNIAIVRAFVRLRAVAAGHVELTKRLDELERKYDSQFHSVFDAIRQLVSQPDVQRKRAGFRAKDA